MPPVAGCEIIQAGGTFHCHLSHGLTAEFSFATNDHCFRLFIGHALHQLLHRKVSIQRSVLHRCRLSHRLYRRLPSYFPAPVPDDKIGSSCSGWGWILPYFPDTPYFLQAYSLHSDSGYCSPAVRQKPAALHKREHLRQLPDTALVRGSPHPPAPDHCFLLRPQTGRRIPHQRAHVPRRQSLPSPGTCLQTLDPSERNFMEKRIGNVILRCIRVVQVDFCLRQRHVVIKPDNMTGDPPQRIRQTEPEFPVLYIQVKLVLLILLFDRPGKFQRLKSLHPVQKPLLPDFSGTVIRSYICSFRKQGRISLYIRNSLPFFISGKLFLYRKPKLFRLTLIQVLIIVTGDPLTKCCIAPASIVRMDCLADCVPLPHQIHLFLCTGNACVQDIPLQHHIKGSHPGDDDNIALGSLGLVYGNGIACSIISRSSVS